MRTRLFFKPETRARRLVRTCGTAVSLCFVLTAFNSGVALGRSAQPDSAQVWPRSTPVAQLAYLTPPYWRFSVLSDSNAVYAAACSQGSGGGWGNEARPIHWDHSTGRFSVAINASSSSGCWTNATSNNMSTASVYSYELISMPIHLASSGGVSVAFNASYRAHEGWFRSPGGCTYNRSQIQSGLACEDDTEYYLLAGASVYDSTSKTTYCNGGSTGVCYGPIFADALRDWTAPCSWSCIVGANNSTAANYNTSARITGSFSKTHSYDLQIWVSCHVYVELDGWRGGGSARIDMAGPNLGIRVASIYVW